MATRTTHRAKDDAIKEPPPPPRVIHTAKPEEGEARGEWAHLLRAVLLIVSGTALLGWLTS